MFWEGFLFSTFGVKVSDTIAMLCHAVPCCDITVPSHPSKHSLERVSRFSCIATRPPHSGASSRPNWDNSLDPSLEHSASHYFLCTAPYRALVWLYFSERGLNWFEPKCNGMSKQTQTHSFFFQSITRNKTIIKKWHNHHFSHIWIFYTFIIEY